MQRREKDEKESNNWAPTPGIANLAPKSSVDSPYPDWKAVGPVAPRTIVHDAQIWESNIVGSGRWPGQVTTPTTQPTTSFTDSGIAGSVSRLPMANRQEDLNTNLNPLGEPVPIRVPTSDMTMTRELEVFGNCIFL